MEKYIPICRVCMQKINEYVDFDMPLQNENEEDTNITYLDFFFECTRIEVEPCDGGSQCFCLPCADELRSFYKFIKIAEMSDRILKENRLIKLKNHQKDDSTFETIAWEPESQDDYVPEYELLNEDAVEFPTDNGKISHGNNKLVYSNCYTSIKESVTNQRLVDLRVEIFHTGNSTPAVTNNSVLGPGNDRKESPIELEQFPTNKTLKEKSQENKGERQVNPTIKTYKKGPVECAFCHEILKNRKRLDKHLIEEHQRRTQPCEICGKMVIRMRDHLLIHYREKNDITRPKVECPICLRRISKQTISRHIRYVHRREVRKQKCSQCSQTFADAFKLKVHMAKGHTLDRTLKCPLCSRVFTNAISLNNHLRTHSCLERKSQKKIFSCDKCPMFFNAKKPLDYHSKVHTSTKFNCEICGQIFSGEGGLRRHLQFHTLGKISCTVCSKAFISPTELDMHMRSH